MSQSQLWTAAAQFWPFRRGGLADGHELRAAITVSECGAAHCCIGIWSEYDSRRLAISGSPLREYERTSLVLAKRTHHPRLAFAFDRRSPQRVASSVTPKQCIDKRCRLRTDLCRPRTAKVRLKYQVAPSRSPSCGICSARVSGISNLVRGVSDDTYHELRLGPAICLELRSR